MHDKDNRSDQASNNGSNLFEIHVIGFKEIEEIPIVKLEYCKLSTSSNVLGGRNGFCYDHQRDCRSIRNGTLMDRLRSNSSIATI